MLGLHRVRFRQDAILCPAFILLLLSSVAQADIWGHWPLDDGQGEIARDLGPRSEDGDVGNFDIGGLSDDGNVWVDDEVRGNVISFSGGVNGAWVFAGFMPETLSDDVDFTWAFWARQDEAQASPANTIILGNRYDANGNNTVPREFVKFTPNRFEYHMDAGIALVTNPDGTESFSDDLQYMDCDFCPERHIPSPSDWLHHAVVKNGPTLTYYRNGQALNSREIGTEQLSPDPLPIFFGGDGSAATGERWRGFLSDVWLYDEALSDADILCVMNGLDKCDGSLIGDFNGDGVLNQPDIDDLTLQSASETNPVAYDLTGDQRVNEADVQFWIVDLFDSWIGDTNLDGQFDTNDLVAMLAAGTYENDVDSVWSTGDFNGSGRTDTNDLVAALSGGGYEQGPRMAVSAVPEPGGLALFVAGLWGIVRRRL